MDLVERFFKYIKIDTQSDSNSREIPTTKKQLDLAKILVEDMKAIGISQIELDPYGIVYASIPTNIDRKCDTIGFISHMDTSPDMSDENVKPRIIQKYNREKVILNESLNIVMTPEEFPNLKKHMGQDLIVTDGTTLLGADDKAGITEILDMCQTIIEENMPHGEIKIAFTPDEEVGLGTKHFDIQKFGADYAYTVDGDDISVINVENFNAASAIVEIKGRNIHPGSAKNKMINAIKLAMKFDNLLPIKDNPALTEGYEGFNHITDIQGDCENAKMVYILRNHSEAILEKQKQDFYRARDFINMQQGNELVYVTITDSYKNMKQNIVKRKDIVEKVEIAMKEIGMNPRYEPIRGGTDGADLSARGLPTPNLGTGGYNFHGKFEYCSIQEMQKMSQLLTKIVTNNAK